VPIIEPDQGLSLVSLADLANNQAAFANYNAGVLSRLNLRYTTAANRTALHPANVAGENSFLTTDARSETNNGAAWVSDETYTAFANLRRAADAAPYNNTVLTADPILTVPLTAAATFTFSGVLIYDATAVADLKLNVSWPAAATGKTWYHGLAPAAVTLDGDARYAVAVASATTFAFAGIGAGVPVFVVYGGRVTTVGAGSLTVNYAQQNVEVSNLTVRSDSTLRAVRAS
jgi:hypothetical protein